MRKDLVDERLKKLSKLKEAGINPYPIKTTRSLEISDARKSFSKLLKNNKKVSLVGRIFSIRDQGGVIFCNIKDETGSFQVVLKKESTKNFKLYKETLDRGDFISTTGFLFKTQRGEESLEVKDVQILTKSIKPLPNEWFGLEETETRLRQRYLDFLMNPETKEIFNKKAVFWKTIRGELIKAGFLEVETPVLENVPGGAEAEPFKTHHNALDTDFFLRISLELPLKKMLVGGFEKVFEIGRIFRNEGIDREHLQDYTQMEFYWAYNDYNDCMEFVEKMYKTVIKEVNGSLVTKWGDKKINWGKKWPKIKYTELFKKINKLDPIKTSKEDLIKKALELGLKPEKGSGKGRLIDLIFKKTVRPNLIQPAFLIDPPVEIEPLAKRTDRDPNLVERFQIVACGSELGKGFSELNDPIDQRKRFEEQMKLRAAGDKEAQMLSEDFIEALEYGMPPAAGFGVSERLFSIILDKPVRETVIFPLVRPK